MDSISVVIPTYRRANSLARCLDAIRRQRRIPNEVIVVVRDTDTESRSFVEGYEQNELTLRCVEVKQAGVVAAMTMGLHAATGSIVALTDDDAAPHSDWLERIEQSFLNDTTLAGVGGRDILHMHGGIISGAAREVGTLHWFSGLAGNHHIGVGKPRYVDALKGVNCAFRADQLRAVGFDSRLKGTGAQVHWERSLCFSLRRAGWHLLYDPDIVVDHFPEVRFDEDARETFNAIALENEVFNEILVMQEHLEPIAFFVYVSRLRIKGSKRAPGLIQLGRLLLGRDKNAVAKFAASRRGRSAALAYARERKSPGS